MPDSPARRFHGLLIRLLLAAPLLLCQVDARAVTYTNITGITSRQLSNGVQVTVTADGVLDWEPDLQPGQRRWEFFDRKQERVCLRFPGARYNGGNFINVGTFPVSHIQISIPQNAKEGVGVLLAVFNFQPSRFSVTRSPDQQNVIITVNSERTLENGAGGGTRVQAAAAASRMEVEYGNGKLTVRTLRARLLPLLAEIARKTGIDVAVDDRNLAYENDVQKGKLVSLTLKDMAVEDVLRHLATAYGLALSRRPDGAYMISDGVPTSLSSYQLSDTRSYPMRYIRAQTASGLLPTFLFSYLHVNPEQNAVVVSAPTQMLGKIEKDLGSVDLAPPQIMVEALAVELADTQDLSTLLRTQWTTPGIDLRTDSSAGLISYDSIGQLPRDFSARIEALVAQGRARIRSRPRMAAVNGQSANIFIGSQKFILVKYQIYGGTSEKIQGVDVGVKLTITPWTGGNGEVTTKIEAEVSNISDIDPQTGLPVLSTRRAATTVRVKDGETVVLGGLVLKQTFDTKRKVPLLGDIPFLGYAFRSRLKQSTNSELAIFITPHVLTDQGRLKDDQEEQRIRDTMLKESGG